MNITTVELDLAAARLTRAEHLTHIQALRQELRDEQQAFKGAGRVVNRHNTRRTRLLAKTQTSN